MRVLLVEDDMQLGAALQRAFELHKFESVWVRRLKDARGLVDHAEPEVIVLDLGLPDGEGLTLLQSIRRDRLRVPVIILTARDTIDECVRGLNSGADDYITKPVAVSELIARIHAVSRRSAGFATSRWTLGEMVIEVDQHAVLIRGETVALTPTEFRLLLQLARQAGRVTSREALLAAVWSGAADGSYEALDYHMHGLRKKVGAERIVTVRGVGFRLSTP